MDNKRKFQSKGAGGARLLLLVLGVLMALPTLAQSFSYNGLNYTVTDAEAKTVKVANNSSVSGDITIPATVSYNRKEYIVAEIGSNAFGGCYGLSAVTIPNSVETIGDYAFYNCSGLTEVIIPKYVTEIGSNAFSGCTGLKKSAYPDTFHYLCPTGEVVAYNPEGSIIKDGCIYDLKKKAIYFASLNLKGDYIIPETVESIGRAAFLGCSGLKSITIPNSVETIGDYAFYGCRGLTEVTIPYSVETIGVDAFAGCTGLTKAIFSSIEHLCSIKFDSDAANPLYYAHHLFIDGNEVSEVVIPSSVTSIGKYAFAGCTGLSAVTIHNSVKTIGAWAFFGCSFSLTSVVIGNSVETIGDYAFAGCSGLKSVTIPNSVTEIGGSAFARCGLTEVTIPNSVTTIGDYAFSRCTGLTEVSIPNSVTYIGSSAFENCYVLTDVTFEDGIEPVALGEHIFNHTSVKNLTIGRNFNSGILESSLSCGGSLNKLTIGNTLTEIPDDAFMDYTNLREVTFGASVETIGNNAFQNCALTEVVLSPATKTIGKNAFKGNNINNVVIGANVTDIGAFAFDCANSFNSVSITAITPPRAKNSTFRYSNCPLYVMPSENDAVKNAYYNTTPCWYRFSGYDLIPIEDVKVEGITSLLFEPGKSVKLEAALSPENASLPYIFWYSTNPEVATIDNYGLVTFHNIKSKDIMEAANNDFANGTLCKIFGETLYANRPKLEIKVTDAPSAIDEIEFEAPYLENGHICGAGVYDLRGVKVGDSIEGLPHGVYILRQGSATKKIAI